MKVRISRLRGRLRSSLWQKGRMGIQIAAWRAGACAGHEGPGGSVETD